MKKSILSLFVIAALAFCSCEKDDVTDGTNGSDNGNPTPDKIDVAPYLGNFLVTRTANITVNVMNMYSIPIDRDFDVETVSVRTDPSKENGIIMTSSDGMYMRGVVDAQGLHLDNDTLAISVDTMGVNVSLSMTMVHPVIAPPADGVYDWTSTATGTGNAVVPVLGNLTATITGEMHYHSIYGDK